jgi:hypothetical protein
MTKSSLKRVSTLFTHGSKKRGQLTLFILVSVVIVLGIVGLIFFISQGDKSKATDAYFQEAAISAQLDVIRDYVDDCIDSVTKESLIQVAVQGGYYTPPARKFSYAPVFFPYYYYEGQIVFPTLSKIESELGRSTNDKIINCLDDADYPNFELDYNKAETEVIVTKDNAYFEIDLPVKIEREGHTMTLELQDFSTNHNSSLYEMYQVAEYITESHEEDAEYYCISCVAEMARERDLFVYVFPQIANELITGIMIYENITGIADPYSFVFFNKYTGNEKTPKLDVD